MEVIEKYIIKKENSFPDDNIIKSIADIYDSVKIKTWNDLELFSIRGGMFLVKDFSQIKEEISQKNTIYFTNLDNNRVTSFASYKRKSAKELINEYSMNNISYISNELYHNFIRKPLYNNSLIQIDEVATIERNKGHAIKVLKEMFLELKELGYQYATTEIYNVVAFKPLNSPFYGYLEKNIFNNASNSFATSIGAEKIGFYSKNIDIQTKIENSDYTLKIQRLLFATNIVKTLEILKKDTKYF